MKLKIEVEVDVEFTSLEQVGRVIEGVKQALTNVQHTETALAVSLSAVETVPENLVVQP